MSLKQLTQKEQQQPTRLDQILHIPRSSTTRLNITPVQDHTTDIKQVRITTVSMQLRNTDQQEELLYQSQEVVLTRKITGEAWISLGQDNTSKLTAELRTTVLETLSLESKRGCRKQEKLVNVSLESLTSNRHPWPRSLPRAE